MHHKKKKHSFLYTTLLFLSVKFLGSLVFFFLITHTPIGATIAPYAAVLTLSHDSDVVVEQVIDGDSLMIRNEQELVPVRLLGINAPEKYDSCYGLEAMIALQEKVLRKSVHIELDPNHPPEDHYGRRLAYVFVDEQHINEWMIEMGYAREYTHREPHTYQAAFRSAEDNAFENKRGLWDRKNCRKD